MINPKPIELPPPVFLGYCVKKYWPIPDNNWDGVKEVCSTSGCIAPRPTGWDEDIFDPPGLNRACCTNSEESAWARVPETERPECRIYAYRAIPVVFGKADFEMISADKLFAAYDFLEELPADHDLSSWQRLGFDVVMYSNAINWGCSPLSCNWEFQQFSVNQYCLIDTIESAMEVARSFGLEEPEPGPYLIVEVSRRTDSDPNGTKLSINLLLQQAFA